MNKTHHCWKFNGSQWLQASSCQGREVSAWLGGFRLTRGSLGLCKSQGIVWWAEKLYVKQIIPQNYFANMWQTNNSGISVSLTAGHNCCCTLWSGVPDSQGVNTLNRGRGSNIERFNHRKFYKCTKSNDSSPRCDHVHSPFLKICAGKNSPSQSFSKLLKATSMGKKGSPVSGRCSSEMRKSYMGSLFSQI